MIKVDNSSFLTFLESENIICNFYTCDNIMNSGKSGYAIKDVYFYTVDGLPSDKYVSFCENIFDELIVEFKTDNDKLIKDAFNEIKKQHKKYKKIRIGANSRKFYDSPLFKKTFKIIKDYSSTHGVFAQFSKDELPSFSIPANVLIQLVKNGDKSQYISYKDDEWDGLSSLIKYGNDNDLFFTIEENSAICGYLIANNSYKNIYDIANVFVAEKSRGRNFGKYLTISFSAYCYANGFIPYYGTAISSYSEAVAIKSGFHEVQRQYYKDVKIKFLARIKS
ncbi:MAG: GNAT family N-acetyltransferase [Oscillospiraceae bacterium]|nr:GNAT family N-acetyltransferase [Oscillospiraceae bacterium]